MLENFKIQIEREGGRQQREREKELEREYTIHWLIFGITETARAVPGWSPKLAT